MMMQNEHAEFLYMVETLNLMILRSSHLHIYVSLVIFAWSGMHGPCPSMSGKPLWCECWALSNNFFCTQRPLWPWELKCIGGVLPGTHPLAQRYITVSIDGAVCRVWHQSCWSARCWAGAFLITHSSFARTGCVVTPRRESVGKCGEFMDIQGAIHLSAKIWAVIMSPWLLAFKLSCVRDTKLPGALRGLCCSGWSHLGHNAN